MNSLRLGQRVRTTVNAPALWSGAPAAPIGSLGTVTALPGNGDSYGVALDVDPEMPASYRPDEITAA